MADPVSIVASALTLIGVAGSSCRYLVNVFDKLAEAPTQLRQHLRFLQALQLTFHELQALAEEIRRHNHRVEMPPGFNARLEHCANDLRAMENRVSQLWQKIEHDERRLLTWTRLKYAIINDRRHRKFFKAAKNYQTTFLYDLMVIQTYVSPTYTSAIVVQLVTFI